LRVAVEVVPTSQQTLVAVVVLAVIGHLLLENQLVVVEP
jgi:hypothetical protein